jgi:hypothetical protein
MLGPFRGSLLLAPWGGTTPEFGAFRGSLLLAPWGWTTPEFGAFRGSLLLAPWGWTLGRVPCVRTLMLGPCAENSSRKSDIQIYNDIIRTLNPT